MEMILKRKPRLITYYITERCNASCPFCDIWKKKTPRDADTETVKELLTQSRKLFGPLFLDLTGGEPLLHDNVAELLRFSRQLGFKTSITTNTKCYEAVSDSIAGEVDFLLFSLDGDREYHDGNRGPGTYDSVMSSIEKARSLGEYPDILMTVTENNLDLIQHVYDIARRAGLILQLNPVFSYFKEMPLPVEALDEMERMGKKPGIYLNRAQTALIRGGGNRREKPRCRGVSSNLVFNVDGDILPGTPVTFKILPKSIWVIAPQ